ncbi:MAG: hypothetical protein U9O20_01560 [Patescibacteria group bacterium]|nr:hypothetical protein [Patescibacteria group bacterium]
MNITTNTKIVTGTKVFVKNKKTGKFLFVLHNNIPTITNPGK